MMMRSPSLFFCNLCAAGFSWRTPAVKWTVFLFQTAAMIFLLYKTTECFLEVKNTRSARLFLAAACALIGEMVILLADMENLPPTLLFFMAAVWFCCRGSRHKRGVMGLIIAGTVFTYNALIDYGFSTFYPAQSGLRLLAGMTLCGCARHFAPKSDFELSRPLWNILLLLTAAPVGIVFSLVLLSRNDQTGNDLQNLMLLFLALFSFAGLLGTTAVLARQNELEESQTLLEMNKTYYKAVEEQNFEIRRMKHDLSNHLQTILSLPAEEKNAYVKKLLENPAAYRTMRYCADETVNIVLSAKASVMERKNILFHVKADIPETLFIEKPDICAIFGNALDNAAEAAELVPEPERYVQLQTRLAKGMFVLRIENPCPFSGKDAGKEPAKKIQGELSGIRPWRIRTTKTDAHAHGYGLKSIEKCVKKYGGEMKIETKGGKFVLFLYIYQE